MDDKLQMWAVLHELIADTQRSGHVRHPNAKERLIDFIWLNRVELSNAAVAMSAQAPGMEALTVEGSGDAKWFNVVDFLVARLEKIAHGIVEPDDTDHAAIIKWASDKSAALRAALQAAERGKPL